MKIFSLYFILMLPSTLASAATFECQTFQNLDVVSSQIVNTEIGVRVEFDETSFTKSYLKQKNNYEFSLEVYLPQHDMRIYSEASVLPQQTITASLWARDVIIDVVCRQLN